MTNVALALIALVAGVGSATAEAAPRDATALYLSANATSVRYISLSISAGVARGFLEEVRTDRNARGDLATREWPLLGKANGTAVRFGSAMLEVSSQALRLDYPTATGTLREERLTRSNPERINVAIRTLVASSERAAAERAVARARDELPQALALADDETQRYARLRLELDRDGAFALVAQRAASDARALARAKHLEAQRATDSAHDTTTLREAAQQLQAAMDLDVDAARALAYATRCEADAAVASDDLAVLASGIANVRRRVDFLRGLVARADGPGALLAAGEPAPANVPPRR